MGKGDEPEPDIFVGVLNGDAYFVAVKLLAGNVVFNMGEQGGAGREVTGALKVEETWQDATEATGIEYKFCTELVGLARCISYCRVG